MPDWKDPAQIAKDGVAFSKLMHALFGLYAYEWFLSLDFDWDFLVGKKRFRWPMIFYFANRYLLLVAMIGIAIALDTTTEVDCQALYTFNQLAGDAAVGLASINLSIRTMAIWSQNRYIIGFLVLIMMGHWSLILQGIQLRAVWIPDMGCSITETNNTILAAIFIYSMCFDLTVLLLNTYKLMNVATKVSPRDLVGSSRLTHMIFADGLIYFIIAFLANLVATVFMLLNLNQIMSVIFNVPAAVLSTGPEVYNATHSTNHRGMTMGTGARGMPTVNYKAATRTGVHVQMETFTHAEDLSSGNDIFTRPKDGSVTDVEGDLERKGSL
ncbi:hypothetical protein NLJ89_g5520 [Agrocybe chaxingu]|uniref:Uncharacterized protein n=1 Tax=Agrocybe chaxingu TaxID=84603 RepID=A0A9W8MTJ0_9AGAR|nr:hypothetical protein NLJ89_g5520 [Agrocybe chaxingu]